MKTIVTEQEGNTVRLDIEVSAEEVQEGLDATVKQLAREVRMPGFRKGKVPLRVVEQRFGMHAIVHQMLEDYLSRWYGPAVDESGIEPVDTPEVDYDDEPEAGQAPSRSRWRSRSCRCRSWASTRGSKCPARTLVVLDEEVDAQVDRLREEFAELSVVRRSARAEGRLRHRRRQGHARRRDGRERDRGGLRVRGGAGRLLPDLEEGIVGMSVEEEQAVPVAFPEDYPSEDLAGKTLDFTVTVKEVKEKVLPALNDEFAKDVSEFETLLELRLDIRRKLQGAKDSAVERRFRGAAIKAADRRRYGELPAVVVDGRPTRWSRTSPAR